MQNADWSAETREKKALGSQHFVPITHRKICQERIKGSLCDQGTRHFVHGAKKIINAIVIIASKWVGQGRATCSL